MSPEIKYLGRTLHRGMPCHTPLRECGGPERRWPLANSRSMEAKSKREDAIESPARSPVVGRTRQHHAGTLPPETDRRSRDREIGAAPGTCVASGRRGKISPERNNQLVAPAQRVARARARGSQPTVGSAPGPRPRARRDARPATCHAGPRAPSAVKRVSRHRVWGPRPARGGDSGSTVTSRGGGRGTSRQGRARGLVGRTTGTRGRARVVRFDRRRSGERARSDGECGQKLCLAGGEMKR